MVTYPPLSSSSSLPVCLRRSVDEIPQTSSRRQQNMIRLSDVPLSLNSTLIVVKLGMVAENYARASSFTPDARETMITAEEMRGCSLDYQGIVRRYNLGWR